MCAARFSAARFSARPILTLAILAAAICLLPHVCRSDTVLQQRVPSVTGCVVDNDPTSYSADGDAVEDWMLVGHANGCERRAVLEYNISDLVPGQVDSVRFQGYIGPNNSAISGLRREEFAIGVGDGAVTVSDNILDGTSNIGGVQHSAGASSTFNCGATRPFRELMLQNRDFARIQVYAGNNPQGWDCVESRYPVPSLALSVRPVTSSTVVYYQPPVATGAATAQGDGPFTVNTAATSADVMNWTYAPYQKGRGLMEFDLCAIPKGARVKWAKLDVYVNGLQNSGSGTIGPDLQIAGYVGDGRISAADVLQPGSILGTSGELNTSGVMGVGALSWDLDSALVENAIASGNYLGCRFQPGVEPELQASITLNDGMNSGQTPRLAIAYEVPEAGTVALLLVAAAFLGCRLKRLRIAR
jgi:hypothetical protein